MTCHENSSMCLCGIVPLCVSEAVLTADVGLRLLAYERRKESFMVRPLIVISMMTVSVNLCRCLKDNEDGDDIDVDLCRGLMMTRQTRWSVLAATTSGAGGEDYRGMVMIVIVTS